MQQKIELVNGKFFMKGEKKEVKSPEEKPIIKKQYSSEVLALKERVIKANQKLFDAWMKIREIHNTEEWSLQMDRLSGASKKLHSLCLELQVKGYEDCLYLDENGKRNKNCFSNPDGFWCQACPSKIPYWQEDARNLPNTEIKGGKNGEPLQA